MVMQENKQRKGSTDMKKNTSKIKNTKAAKASGKKNAAKPVTPALSNEKIEQVKAIAASGVRDPEMLEAAINAIVAAPEPAAKEKSEARDGSKKATVLALLRRDGGATLGEIALATDWQLHSIRGFLSGQIAKKMGLKIDSTKDDGGKRRYHIAG